MNRDDGRPTAALFFAGLGVLLLLAGSYWGLFVAPAETYMGDVQRIMYVHVPTAWNAMLAFTFTFGCALAFLFLAKMLGWAALAAWSAAAARGRPLGIGASWFRVVRRLPEVVLAGSLVCLGFVAGGFTFGFGWIVAAPPVIALAATTSDDAVGGWRMLRRGFGATLDNLDRASAILFTAFLAALLLFVNLMALLPMLLALGAGGLGLDLEILGSGFGFSRFATWVFAACLTSVVVEAFVVTAFAELDADRELEREGVRFEQFAAELEARDAAAAARSAA